MTPLSARTCSPPHSIGSFSSCHNPRTEVYHLERTLSNAIARNPRGPFCSSGVGLLEKCQAQDFARLGGSPHSPPETSIDSLGDPASRSPSSRSNHSPYSFIIFPRARRNLSTVNLDSSSLPSNQTVSSASLISYPLRVHLRSLVFVVVTSFAVGPHIFRPPFSLHWLVRRPRVSSQLVSTQSYL